MTKIETEIINSDETVKKFIIKELKKILAGRDEYKEALYGFLGYDDADMRGARLDRIFDIIDRKCKWSHTFWKKGFIPSLWSDLKKKNPE